MKRTISARKLGEESAKIELAKGIHKIECPIKRNEAIMELNEYSKFKTHFPNPTLDEEMEYSEGYEEALGEYSFAKRKPTYL